MIIGEWQVMASAHGKQKRKCCKGPMLPWSVVPAGTLRKYLRYPAKVPTSMIPLCRQHGHRSCYTTVPCSCSASLRVTYNAYELHLCVTVRRHILQYKPAVVSRSSAALFNEDTNTRLKVKWLYCKCSADRSTISLTHSKRVSYTLTPTVGIGHFDNGYEIS